MKFGQGSPMAANIARFSQKPDIRAGAARVHAQGAQPTRATLSPAAQDAYGQYLGASYGGRVPGHLKPTQAAIDAGSMSDAGLYGIMNNDAQGGLRRSPADYNKTGAQAAGTGVHNPFVRGRLPVADLPELPGSTGDRKTDFSIMQAMKAGMPYEAARSVQEPMLKFKAENAQMLGPTGLFGNPLLGTLLTAGFGMAGPAAAGLAGVAQKSPLSVASAIAQPWQYAKALRARA